MKNQTVDTNVIRVNEVQCGRVFTRPMAKQVVQLLKSAGWPVRYVRQAHTAAPWVFVDVASAEGFTEEFYEACNEVLTPYIQPTLPTVRVWEANGEEK